MKKIILTIFLTFLLFSIPLLSADEDIEKLEEKASRLYQNNDYEHAIKSYLRLLELNPTMSKNYYYNIACCYALENNFQSALEYLKKSIDAGFEPISQILLDSDFSNLIEIKEFQDFIKQKTIEKRQYYLNEIKKHQYLAKEYYIRVADTYTIEKDFDNIIKYLNEALNE